MGNSASIRVGAPGAKAASSDIDRLHDKFIRLQKQGAKGFAVGVGAAATLKAFSLIDRAISGTIDLMGQAVEGALADEESQNRLRASLKTNVPAWDGTTDAIERRILAGQRLGFADETMRDSLTVLVGATHDVGKAFEVMGIAQDLARFKGIDLKTASEALIKVEGGVYRSLKQLGIQLKDGATSQEALAAVQKVTAGQAEAYANTNRGKLLASQIRVNEVMEKLGGKIMPVVVSVMDDASFVVDQLAKSMDGASAKGSLLDDKVTRLDGSVTTLGEATRHAREPWTVLTDAFNDWKTSVEEAAVVAEQNANSDFGGLPDSLHRVWQGGLDAAKGMNAAGIAAWHLRPDLKKIVADADKAADALGQLIFGPAELRAHKTSTILQIKDLKDTLAKLKGEKPTRAVREDIASTQEQLGHLGEDLLTTDEKLAALGDKPAKDELARWLTDHQKQLQDLGADAWADIDALSILAGVPVPGRGILSGGKPNLGEPPGYMPPPPVPSGGKPPIALAGGGIVNKPTFAMIAESGPEAVVPLSRGGMAIGGTLELHLHLQGAWTPSQGAQFARDAWPWIAREARRVGAF